MYIIKDPFYAEFLRDRRYYYSTVVGIYSHVIQYWSDLRLKVISSSYYFFYFVTCKTSQNVKAFCNNLHEVNLTFQNNCRYGCEAVEALCFYLSHIT